jgi:hypothetical protein
MTDRSYTIKETTRVSGLTEDTPRYDERNGVDRSAVLPARRPNGRKSVRQVKQPL